MTPKKPACFAIAITACCLVFPDYSAGSEAVPSQLLGLPKGEISAKFSFFGSNSRHTFNQDGNKVSFALNGESSIYGTHLELLYGLTDRITVYADIPYLKYNLSDDVLEGAGSGIGDSFVSGRFRFFSKPIESWVELGLKMPTADSIDPSQVLVGEGQYDLTTSLLLGVPIKNLSGWVTGQLGYRYREKDSDRSWKPGNEFVYRIEGGYNPPGRLAMSLALNGFRGAREESFGLKLDDSERELASIVPSISYSLFRSWALQVDYTLPIDGRNYYAGGILGAAFVFSSSNLETGTTKNYVPSVRGVSCCLPR
jgi:hypothetical protein